MDRAENTMSNIYSEPGFVSTFFDAISQIIFVNWFDYKSKIHLRKSLEAQLRIMEKTKVRVVLIDSSEAVGLSFPEDTRWFETDLYPSCKKYGLQLVVVIHPKNAISKIVTRNWTELGKKFDLLFAEASNVSEGRFIISQMTGNKARSRSSIA